MSFARVDQSPVAQWWWTVDRWTLAALLALIGFAALLVMAASPAVADRIGADNLPFVKRFFAVIPLAVTLLLAVSLQSPPAVRRVAGICFALSLTAPALTFVVGVDT